MDFSVVIPCYNEKENIPMLLDGFARALQGKEDWVEVILVDNGSTDGSGEVLDKLLPGYPFSAYGTGGNKSGLWIRYPSGASGCKGQLCWMDTCRPADRSCRYPKGMPAYQGRWGGLLC